MIFAAMYSSGAWASWGGQQGSAATRGSQSIGRRDWSNWSNRQSAGYGNGGGNAATRASSARPPLSRRGPDAGAAPPTGAYEFLASDDAKDRIGTLLQFEHEVLAGLGSMDGQLPFLGRGVSAMFGSDDPRVCMRMLQELGRWVFSTRQRTPGQTGVVRALQGMEHVLKNFQGKLA